MVVEAFVEAVKSVFPQAVLQWEDFKQHNALRILDRYRHRLPSFNDDIQGTGAVVVGGLLAARRAQGGLAGERFMLIGAGAAGIGIARTILRELISEGLSADEAKASLALMNSAGLVHTGRTDLSRRSARVRGRCPVTLRDRPERSGRWTRHVAVARAFKPTILIGTTGQRGAFNEELVREMACTRVRPIIMPLSNPDVNAEARAEDVLEWTEGRAIVATGSPAATSRSAARRRPSARPTTCSSFRASAWARSWPRPAS